MFGDVFDNSREASGASASTAAPTTLRAMEEGQRHEERAQNASGYSPTSSMLSSARFEGGAHERPGPRAGPSRPEAAGGDTSAAAASRARPWPNERTPIHGGAGPREFHRVYAYDPWTKRPVVIKMSSVRRFWCWEFGQSGWWIGFTFLVRRRRARPAAPPAPRRRAPPDLPRPRTATTARRAQIGSVCFTIGSFAGLFTAVADTPFDNMVGVLIPFLVGGLAFFAGTCLMFWGSLKSHRELLETKTKASSHLQEHEIEVRARAPEGAERPARPARPPDRPRSPSACSPASGGSTPRRARRRRCRSRCCAGRRTGT